jgi:hypothetical protein
MKALFIASLIVTSVNMADNDCWEIINESVTCSSSQNVYCSGDCKPQSGPVVCTSGVNIYSNNSIGRKDPDGNVWKGSAKISPILCNTAYTCSVSNINNYLCKNFTSPSGTQVWGCGTEPGSNCDHCQMSLPMPQRRDSVVDGEMPCPTY